MIEIKKEQIKDVINKTQKQIDDAPQYLIRLKDKMTDLEQMIKMVSEEKYTWKTYTKTSEQKPEPLKIYDEVKDNSGTTSVHF
jgi:chromosome segregation ATPase